MSQTTDVIGVGEAAEMLGWSRAKLKRLALRDKFPIALKVPGVTGAYLFDRATVQRIANVQRGLEEALAGNTRPADEVLGELGLDEAS